MKIAPLSKKKDFDLLFRKGKRIFKGHLTLIYFFLTDDICLNCLKIAYIVSKKISSKAVIRNKIKRRMKSAMRKALTEMELNGSILNRAVWVAMLPSKKILDVSFQQIYLDTKQALAKIMRSQ